MSLSTLPAKPFTPYRTSPHRQLSAVTPQLPHRAGSASPLTTSERAAVDHDKYVEHFTKIVPGSHLRNCRIVLRRILLLKLGRHGTPASQTRPRTFGLLVRYLYLRRTGPHQIGLVAWEWDVSGVVCVVYLRQQVQLKSVCMNTHPPAQTQKTHTEFTLFVGGGEEKGLKTRRTQSMDTIPG